MCGLLMNIEFKTNIIFFLLTAIYALIQIGVYMNNYYMPRNCWPMEVQVFQHLTYNEGYRQYQEQNDYLL